MAKPTYRMVLRFSSREEVRRIARLAKQQRISVNRWATEHLTGIAIAIGKEKPRKL